MNFIGNWIEISGLKYDGILRFYTNNVMVGHLRIVNVGFQNDV